MLVVRKSVPEEERAAREGGGENEGAEKDAGVVLEEAGFFLWTRRLPSLLVFASPRCLVPFVLLDKVVCFDDDESDEEEVRWAFCLLCTADRTVWEARISALVLPLLLIVELRHKDEPPSDARVFSFFGRSKSGEEDNGIEGEGDEEEKEEEEDPSIGFWLFFSFPLPPFVSFWGGLCDAEGSFGLPSLLFPSWSGAVFFAVPLPGMDFRPPFVGGRIGMLLLAVAGVPKGEVLRERSDFLSSGECG